MSCLVAASDTPARYAAGTLEPTEVPGFEDHLLECAACQEAVREAAGLRAALRSASAAKAAESVPRLRRWGAALALATAAGILIVVWAGNAVERLGRLERAPEFQGLAVRADADSAAEMVDRGMEAYGSGDYAAAAQLLGQVAGGGGASPSLSFFLGVSLLMEGRDADAVSALTAAALPEGNPYEAEARLYLAKARLRLGDAPGALDELVRVSEGTPVHAWAAALADSVRGAMR